MTVLTACISTPPTQEQTRWFQGELTAPKNPVIITIKGLTPNTPYNISVYDRYHQSELQETASTKTTLMRPDKSIPESYKGTHDGVHYSDDPGGITVIVLDSTLLLSIETSKTNGVGFFRISIRPASEDAVVAAQRVNLVLDGIPVIRKGTPGDSPVTKGYGIFMHGSSIVPEARDLMGLYAAGGDYIFVSAEKGRFVDLPEVRSAESLILDTPARANAPYAAKRAELASALLFDGGDQSIYYTAWIDSAFARSVTAAVAKRQASIGGNSAGLAILGDIVYAALHDESLSADEALQNPYSPLITLRTGPFRIPELKGAITETHFSERNRQGRLIAFLARMLADTMVPLTDAYGIAVDENTCLVIDNEGKTRVFGQGSAWIYVPMTMPDTCKAGVPLTWKGNAIKVLQLTPKSPSKIWTTIKQQPAAFYYEVLEGKLVQR